MHSTELARAIEEMERKESVLLANLDDLFVATRKELVQEASTWIRSEVERRVSEHPEVVQSLGIEKLRLLKEQVADLVQRLPEIVNAETAIIYQLPHHASDSGTAKR